MHMPAAREMRDDNSKGAKESAKRHNSIRGSISIAGYIRYIEARTVGLYILPGGGLKLSEYLS